MTKYHIKKDGTPGICKAKQNCPLGGTENHIEANSLEEAQAFADKHNAKHSQKYEQPKGHRRNKRRYTMNIKESLDNLQSNKRNEVRQTESGDIIVNQFNGSHNIIARYEQVGDEMLNLVSETKVKNFVTNKAGEVIKEYGE